MIWESGENWYQDAAYTHHRTIDVIERPEEGYEEYADRREREKGARRVPFGFARALVDEDTV